MATRLYFSSTAAAAVSPSFQSYSHAMTVRRGLLRAIDTSALSTDAVAPDGSDHLVAGDVGTVQYVSAPIAKGTVFTSGAAFKYAVQCLEAHAGNNLQAQIFMSVVSLDGTSVLATIRSKQAEGTEVNNALRNVFYSGTLSDGFTVVVASRLVIEFSFTGTPTGTGGVQGHNGSMRWGCSAAGGDLPENDTETGTTLRPWIEFADNIYWPSMPVWYSKDRPVMIPRQRVI